jgi:hypothetical protein
VNSTPGWEVPSSSGIIRGPVGLYSAVKTRNSVHLKKLRGYDVTASVV